MKVAGGLSENGVVIGNTYDKYGSKNPIVKRMMAGFDNALSGFVSDAAPQTIHEVGCGEGFWAMTWAAEGKQVRGITLPVLRGMAIWLKKNTGDNLIFSPLLSAVENLLREVERWQI